MKFLKQSFVKYGLIMAAVTSACLLLMELTGQNKSFDSKSVFEVTFMFIAPFVVWYFGIKAKRHALKNKMTFKQGFNEGFKISLVYGVVSPFIFLKYYLFVNPSILTFVKEAYGMSSASDSMVIAVDMVAQFIAALVFGAIYAAIISFILKTKS